MGSATNWSYTTGEKGRNRVRAFERKESGIIYLGFFSTDPETGEPKRKRISTKHRDRDEAKRQADRLAAKLGEQRKAGHARTTIRQLFDNYVKRRTPQVGDRQQRFHRRCHELYCRYFGPGREVQSFNRSDWDDFIRDRSSGKIDARGNPVPEPERKPVSNRTVKRDLQGLRAALNWGAGADLLSHDPSQGYPFPKVNEPRRPRVSQERYEAMRAAASEVDWRFELALVLAHETGHRIRAIRHLQWSDIDLVEQQVLWRAEADKTGREHVTPLSEAACEALREAQSHRPAVGGTWVLPSPTDLSAPVSRHLVRDWWHQGEEEAGLDHVEGLGWHGLRRKFADELREAPLKDLADLGGWATPRTILECYQDSDMEAMRRAQQLRRPLREEAYPR